MIVAGFALSGHAGLTLDPLQAPNLLVNGSFEKGTEGWTFSAYKKKGQIAMDESVQFQGKPSVRLENTEGDDSFLKQTVAVKPNTRYRMSGCIKTKDVLQLVRDGKNGASLALEGGFLKTKSVLRTEDWTQVSFEFATGNQTEFKIGPRLGFYSALTTGTAWFANVSLQEVGKAPPWH
jgi:hypothetical protein